MASAPKSGSGQDAAAGDSSEWRMIRQLRSEDPVYRKFSSIADPAAVERSRRSKFGTEIISMAWSPDSNIFAWSVGSNFIYLHAVSQLLPANISGDDLGGMVPSHDRNKSGFLIELDCGVPVTALYFGSRVSDKKWHAGEVKYNRMEEQVKGQLVLASGLATGDIKIWEVATGKLMTVLKDHTDAVTDLQFSPDGSLVLCSASKDCTVKFWDLLDDGNMFRTLERDDAAAKKPIKKVTWSPDAKLLATVGDNKLALIYETSKFTVQSRLQGHQNDVSGCRFSDSGDRLYTASFDTSVICWKVTDGSRVRTFHHMSPPPSAIFASGQNDHQVIDMDKRKGSLATLCQDGILRIWQVARQDDQPILEMDVVPEGQSLSFADNGQILAVGCQGGIVQFLRYV